MCQTKIDENISRLILIHDPSGVYPKDRWFYRMAWQETLESGYWPTGSVWRAEVHEGSD
jgi:hypothetical protein